MNPIPLEEQIRSMYPVKLKPGTSLRQLVNRLLANLLVKAAETRTSIVNEVSAGFFFVTDEKKVTALLHELLHAVVRNARNGNIHISADRLTDTLSIHIEERNNYNGYALAHSIKSIEPDALMVNGCILMKACQSLETTITLNFPDDNRMTNYDC